MPSWYLKAGIQGFISLLPTPHAVNYMFQRYVSKGLILTDGYFEEKLKVTAKHIENYRKATEKQKPQNVLELGTGWLPIVPIALSLCGIEEVYSVDISDLTKAHLVKETIEHFIVYAQDGRLKKILPIDTVDKQSLQSAYDALANHSVEESLKHLHITPLVTDARSLKFDDNSIEFFVSNSTFEHIPPDVLLGIMQEFHRVSTPNGVNSHLIDLGDHYAQFDKSLSPYNFLRYSDSIWRLFNNKLQYQNRLRVSDYRKTHEQAGFHIKSEVNQIAEQHDIEKIQLADQFQAYSYDDVIVVQSFMVSQPKGE